MLEHGNQIDASQNKMTESLRDIKFLQISPKAVKKKICLLQGAQEKTITK